MRVDGDKIRIRTDTALFNAGIVGLVRFLKYIGYDGYRLENDEIVINKEFFERDLATDYIGFIIDSFGKESKMARFMAIDVDESGEDELKKNFENYLNRKTHQTVCDNYEKGDLKELFEHYPKDRLATAKNIQNALKNDSEMEMYLTIAECVWENFQFFFNGFAFLSYGQGSYSIKKGITFEDCIKDFLFDKVKAQIQNEADYQDGKKSVACMQCREQFGKNKGSMIEMTFIKSYIDDMSKKTSTFWNKKADSYICPLCAFVYAFMPFGFFCVDTGAYYKDRLFVNRNGSIESLVGINTTLAEKYAKDPTLKRGNVFNLMIDYELQEMARQQSDGIEVVSLIFNSKRCFYSSNVVGKSLLSIFQNANDSLARMVNSKVKLRDGDYINVFAEVVDNVLNFTNQWILIDTLIRGGASTFVTDNVLQVQVIQNAVKQIGAWKLLKDNVAVEASQGVTDDSNKAHPQKRGKEIKTMEEIKKTVQRAKYDGQLLRKDFGMDADNKMRGYVYKLTNALSTGNRDMFLDTVTRMYGGMGREIPSVLMNVFAGMETFKEIGYAYVIGLNSNFGGDKKESTATDK
ncbi:MAG: type I-B CRISPR-associated protein Cas8b1/Cst1 [Clostridia bacterium]|nr:type I-B CRISPR-associated protein Cas8b1/Cst1 [Clostridia bacterium]